MKHLPIFLISLILFLTISCSDKTATAKEQLKAEMSKLTAKDSDREQSEKEFCIRSLESFLSVDEEHVKKSEELYLQLLGNQVEHVPTANDSIWYRQNIAHIDSVARYCIELRKNDNTTELLSVLETELPNFQSHPNADTYACFDLNIILTQLYMAHADSCPDYKNKCVSLWELNRVQIEAVQNGWEEYHPLYKEVLKILLGLYKSTDNIEKASEMEKRLAEVTAQQK